jgi:protein-S-isoprenylcysteine O-methyltransferase Ste14
MGEGEERAEDRGGDPSRRETETERMDRNWNELLQELRVTQTGVQILTGFLLTLPFQQRFTSRDTFQVTVFCIAVLLSATATALIVAPVSYHRLLFRQRKKALLVRASDRLARAGLLTLALAVSVVVLLVFDVAVSRRMGIICSLGVLLVFVVLWLVLPLAGRRSPNLSSPAEPARSR